MTNRLIVRFATLSLSLLGLLAACSTRDAETPSPDPSPGPESTARVGEPAVLRATTPVAIVDTPLELTLLGVADSRCPIGVTCVWAGDAAVSVLATGSAGAPDTLSLHTHDSMERSATVDGFEIALTRVTPVPKEGETIAPEHYTATVVVSRP